ncbi:hypothetical protein IQ244_07165 [Nostoc sp. LEGE 06077]|uniref:hypothetical protein n=1 Tax=Nostoc sp. LEGE 06077 TaxID=915325 RepID=UPI001881DEEA|nr:hypothetical protein [Nostoc sp. LEGE 06077]MBE9206294.1 hypothetical protein [Nostoc sp. LEGE 06077]
MQVHELLQFVDEAVYTKTGKHLNDLQCGVIEGTLKHQIYSDIADNCDCSPGHAKDVGYELLQMLSDVFDEPVDKGNIKSVLERQRNINISLGENSTINNNIVGCINFNSKQPKVKPNKSNSDTSNLRQNSNYQTKIDKLRRFGLNDEQIAEALELPLDVIKQVG